jgi:hypothetical protein
VDIKHFLNCNKVKKMGVNNITEIANAVLSTSTLELNPDKTMLRRKDMAALPEFQPKKKVKVSEDGAKGGEGGKTEKTSNPYDNLEPYN